MTSHKDQTADFSPLLAEWIKAATQMWASAAKFQPQQGQTTGQTDPHENDAPGRTQESWDVSFKAWQAAAAAMGDPTFWGAFLKGTNAMPEMMFKIANSGWEGFLQIQRQWIEKAGKTGKKTQAYDFDQLDKGFFKIWSEVYEKELRQYFNVPQLGLLRFYQEKINKASDQFNRFSTAVGAFLHLLTLPVEKSLKVLQAQLNQMAEEGNLPENPKDYYNMWIKILEGHYMTLFKSPDYVQSMGKTIDTLNEFMAVRQEVAQDLLQTLPIPTQKEVDELYKEIYLLKKKIKALEQQLSNQ